MTLIDAAPREALVEWQRLLLTGPDSEGFLQGQWSQDVSLLTSGAADGLILEPNGNVIAVVRAQRIPTGLALDVRKESGSALEARLRRFRLRVQVEFSWTESDPEAVAYQNRGEQLERGWPGPAEFAGELIAQSFGQSFIERTVCFSKGCFTGQELVGRLDARGAATPFRLARLRGSTVDELDELVRATGPSGERARQGVTTAITTPTGVEAFAIVHRSFDVASAAGEWV